MFNAFVLVLATVTGVVTVAAATENDGDLLIGAFNIQVFGKTKVGKQNVVDVLTEILLRYDLVAIMEIRDSSQTAFPKLVEALNAKAGWEMYEFVTGRRVGRTTSKEQYGFIYRPDKLDIVSMYERKDEYDVFEREPLVVRFRRITDEGRQREFTYIVLHAKPDDALAEMNNLVDVCEEAERVYGNDVIIAGDLNADCTYVCNSCWDDCTLRQNAKFKWLLSDGVDTTTKKTDCAYDRIILKGESIQENASGASVYRFDTEMDLDQELVEDVSDHYPVEFTLH